MKRLFQGLIFSIVLMSTVSGRAQNNQELIDSTIQKIDRKIRLYNEDLRFFSNLSKSAKKDLERETTVGNASMAAGAVSGLAGGLAVGGAMGYAAIPMIWPTAAHVGG